MKTPLQILKARLGKGSQAELARELDVSPQYLHDVLNGRREPGRKILKALGVERVVSYRPLRETPGL
jgi:hypothetical protein